MIDLERRVLDQHRSRTWHSFRDGVCYQRTLIDETRATTSVKVEAT
jgi:hypothetical protein